MAEGQEMTLGERARLRAEAIYGPDSDSVELLRKFCEAQGGPLVIRCTCGDDET